ncbi:MAG: M24 family metallopeptidase [Alphaproteobacteria bacterium]
MPATEPPFSSDEYARRLQRTRAEMRRRELAALFVADPSNMAWLTGYDGWSFYVPQGVVVTHDGDPIWWGRRQDAAGARRTVWMADNRVASYPEHLVQATDGHPMQDLAALLRDAGLGEVRLGLEFDNYYFSAKAYLTLQEELPAADLIDATGVVNWQRAVKSDEEIVFMRRAAAISERMVDGVLARIEPGLAKNEMVAEIFADAIRGVDGAWGDYPAIVPLVPSGSDAAAPHLTWDGRRFESGEATFFEVAGCYRRYHAPLCRTVFLGTPPQYLLDAEKAVIEGLEAGLDVARPGATAGDVARALFAALRKIGIEREARCGYPIGLSYPPDWGERTISFRPSDETPLQAGMTFHFMPGLWMDDWGLEITESILICDGGPAECLCDRPRPIFVKA